MIQILFRPAVKALKAHHCSSFHDIDPIDPRYGITGRVSVLLPTTAVSVSIFDLFVSHRSH